MILLKHKSLYWAMVGLLLPVSLPAAERTPAFKKIHPTDQFWAEGAHFGDFNHDGQMDLVYGPFWFAGPDFKKSHEYSPANAIFKRKKSDGTEETVPGFEGGLGINNAYSDNFFAFTQDFNKDGWDDILIYGFPGKDASWYENPKGKAAADGTEHWTRHKVFDVVDNESPTFGDLTGDGKPNSLNESVLSDCCRLGKGDKLVPAGEGDWGASG